MRAPSFALAFGVIGIVGLTAAAGCEAIVSSQVPPFTCADSDPSSCPVGQMCATTTGQCIAASKACTVNPCSDGLECDPGTLKCVTPGTVDAGPDATVPVKDSGGVDAKTDTSMPGTDSGLSKPYPNGIGCSAAADCMSGLCADSAELGPYTMKTGSVCSIPCCTSEQCGAGLVCVGPGTGGHYCVPAALIGVPIGGAKGGASCVNPSDCRSGQCIASVCTDSCCVDTDCTSGAKCRITALPAGHLSYACGKGGTKAVGATCSTIADCQSGACYGGSPTCRAACCGQTSAIAQNYGACSYLPAGTGDLVSGGLFPGLPSPGVGAVGTACTQSSDCQSYFCTAAVGGVCSDVCCSDADCATYGTYSKCLPSATMGNHPLICVKAN
jgi:hypothetical protein